MYSRNVCAYCKASSMDLVQLNNFELLGMMREKDRTLTESSQFCNRCRERMEAKLTKRKSNRFAATGTISHFNLIPGHEILPSHETTSSGGQEAETSRNVAKRTGGKPTHPTSE